MFPIGTKLKPSAIGCSRREQPIARLVVSPLFLMQQTIKNYWNENWILGGSNTCGILCNIKSVGTNLWWWNVILPSNGQGCKVEIYRNGVKLVNTAAPAGTSLCYMLCKYGNGEFKLFSARETLWFTAEICMWNNYRRKRLLFNLKL